jgi:fatty-acyl-CoA synthase
MRASFAFARKRPVARGPRLGAQKYGSRLSDPQETAFMTNILKTTGCVRPIATLADIQALEADPYDELVPARSVYDMFVANATLHGERPALTVLASADAHDVALALTHRELLREINRAANLFASLGIGDDDVVGIVARTHARVPQLIWGAQTAGIVSCLNYMLAPDTLAELLRVERCKVLVCPGADVDAELWAKMRRVVDTVPSVETIVVIGRCDGEDKRFIPLESALASQDADSLAFHRILTPATRAALFHTGGTTGLPKLVPHTHGNQIHAAWSFAQAFDITEKDVGMNGLPMFHVGGTSTWGLSVLGAAGHIVVMGPIGYRDPEMVRDVWAIAERYKATMTGSVPTTIGAMSEVPVGDHDLSTLRMAQTGGAVLPKAVAERFERRAGIPLLEQYGMTESVATIASTPFRGEHVRGSVGLRCPFMELRVVRLGHQGPPRDVDPGETGVVICRGRQIVTGYVDPRHSAGAFTPDGWLITGDLGCMSDQGRLVLTGREKDLIIRGGHNIDPAAIEEVATMHPTVGSCAAVGMPDAYAGEVPVIFVVPSAGATIDSRELAAYLQSHIHEPPAKPRHIFVLDALPTTTVGKIYKPALRERAVREKLQHEAQAIDAALRVEDVAFSRGPQGRSAVRVALAGADTVDRAHIERLFGEAVRDLPFDTTVQWV